jgi:hypothetical protein
MTSGQSTGGAASGATVPDDEQKLREDIEQTRERLGETVDQLAAKADVKERARAKAAALAGQRRVQLGAVLVVALAACYVTVRRWRKR